MSVYRIVLLVMVVPCLVHVDGRKSRADTDRRHRSAAVCVLGHAQPHCHPWIGLSVQTAGIICIETLGPYMLARCYVRDADDFYNVVQLLFRIVVCLLPFAALLSSFPGKTFRASCFNWSCQRSMTASAAAAIGVNAGTVRSLIIQSCSEYLPAVFLRSFTWFWVTGRTSFSVFP